MYSMNGVNLFHRRFGLPFTKKNLPRLPIDKLLTFDGTSA